MASRRQTLPPPKPPWRCSSRSTNGPKALQLHPLSRHTEQPQSLRRNTRSTCTTRRDATIGDSVVIWQTTKLQSMQAYARSAAAITTAEATQDLAAERPGSLTSTNHCKRNVRLG